MYIACIINCAARYSIQVMFNACTHNHHQHRRDSTYTCTLYKSFWYRDKQQTLLGAIHARPWTIRYYGDKTRTSALPALKHNEIGVTLYVVHAFPRKMALCVFDPTKRDLYCNALYVHPDAYYKYKIDKGPR